jgi:Abortive infection alpha
VGITEDTPNPADAIIDRVGHAAGWLARTGWRVTRGLPGGELAERQLLKLETAVVAEVRRRLDPQRDTTTPWRLPGLGALDARIDRTATGDLVTLVRPMNGQVEPLRAGMAELLNQSANADTTRATEYLYTTILRQLVPDEARILAALADGVPRPAVDVIVRTTLGNTQRTVLRNASSVGRHAGVVVPAYVPAYLTRLYRMGVVDIGDEDPALAEQYDILLTDQLVRAAEERARHARKGAARIVRRTVAISDLGGRFWAECDPTVGNLPRHRLDR